MTLQKNLTRLLILGCHSFYIYIVNFFKKGDAGRLFFVFIVVISSINSRKGLVNYYGR